MLNKEELKEIVKKIDTDTRLKLEELLIKNFRSKRDFYDILI